MRRWLTQICVFLLLGAIVNVAVAWTCVASFQLDLAVHLPTSSTRDEVMERYRASVPSDLSAWNESGAIEFRAFGIEKDVVTYGGDDFFSIDGYRGGWPLLSLSGHSWAWLTPAKEFKQRRVGLTPKDSIIRTRNPLPWHPLWPGFAINTVFHAVIMWLLFAGPFELRRWRRIRRGLCPKCAYDLRGTPRGAAACPECGAAVLK